MKKGFLFLSLSLLFSLSSCAYYADRLRQNLKSSSLSKRKVKQKEKQKEASQKISPPRFFQGDQESYYTPLIKKRYKAHDLSDQEDDGSLWSGLPGKDRFLFTSHDKKGEGDVVLISVSQKFKNEILTMLRKNNKSAKPTKKKMVDYISSVVIETVGPQHLLLQGQKFLHIENERHGIELKALVARKNISENDTVDSDHLIEANIRFLGRGEK